MVLSHLHIFSPALNVALLALAESVRLLLMDILAATRWPPIAVRSTDDAKVSGLVCSKLDEAVYRQVPGMRCHKHGNPMSADAIPQSCRPQRPKQHML